MPGFKCLPKSDVFSKNGNVSIDTVPSIVYAPLQTVQSTSHTIQRRQLLYIGAKGSLSFQSLYLVKELELDCQAMLCCRLRGSSFFGAIQSLG